MPKIQRKISKIFAVNSPLDRVAVVGSLRQGNPQYSKDIDALQSLSNFEDGWPGIAIGVSSPPLEDMNAIQFVFSEQQKYQFQSGVPEWHAAETYYKGSIVSDGSGNLFVSIQDDNTNHTISDSAWWTKQGNSVKNVTANYTVIASDNYIRGNAVGAPGNIINVTLPAMNTIPIGHTIKIKNVSAPVSSGAVRVIVSNTGTDTIDLGPTEIILQSGPPTNEAVTLIKGSATNWDIL